MDGDSPVSTYIRYAHSDGHAVVCHVPIAEQQAEEQVHLATVGVDGDVRLWRNIDDDDPRSHHVAESLTALCVDSQRGKPCRLIVGTDYNAAAAFTLPDMTPDGVVTRFTAEITDLHAQAGWVAAASCDMHVRVTAADGSSQCCLPVFPATVLCVLLAPPRASHLLTVCCDGSVTFWRLDTARATAPSCTRIVQHSAVLPRCNDISTSKSRVRCDWREDGSCAAVPLSSHVQLYSAASEWQPGRRLTSELIKDELSACQFSPCGRLLAASTVRGLVLLWRMADEGSLSRGASDQAVKIYEHETSAVIITLSWHPDGTRLAFTDFLGQLGVSSGVDKLLAREKRDSDRIPTDKRETTVSNDRLMNLDELERAIDENDDGLEEDDDDILEAVMKQDKDFESAVPPTSDLADDDDDDDNTISLHKLKAEAGFAELGVGQSAGAASRGDSGAPDARVPRHHDHASLVAETAAAAVRRMPRVPVMQAAFQPSSTPQHLQRRFMVWNQVGAVLAHDDESSIDVEFHDVSTHHPLHIHNVHSHRLADLSSSALVLVAPHDGEEGGGGEQDDDQEGGNRARLQCIRLAAWDDAREWHQQLPPAEHPVCVCVADEWLAVVSSGGMVRVFSVSGVQLLVTVMGGRPLCAAAQGSRLLLMWHAAVGGVEVQVFSVHVSGSCSLQPAWPTKTGPVRVPACDQDSVSISWAGVCVDTGAPCVQRSDGEMFVLSGRHGALWTPVSVGTGDAAHLFVVSVHERRGLVTGVLCRGARYPAVLPRPVLTRLTARLPFCETNTERARWEAEAALLHHQLAVNRTSDTDRMRVDEQEEEEQQEHEERRRSLAVLLTKLFALACKSEQQQRALDVARQLAGDTDTLHALAGYANRQRQQQLVERLAVLIENASHEVPAINGLHQDHNLDRGQDRMSSPQYSQDLFQPSARGDAAGIDDYGDDESVVENTGEDNKTDRPSSRLLCLPDSLATQSGSVTCSVRPRDTPTSRNPFRCTSNNNNTSSTSSPVVPKCRNASSATAMFDNLPTNITVAGKRVRDQSQVLLKPAKVKKSRNKRATSM